MSGIVSTKLFSDAVSLQLLRNVLFLLIIIRNFLVSYSYPPSTRHCYHQLSAAIERTTDVDETRSTRDTRATSGIFSMMPEVFPVFPVTRRCNLDFRVCFASLFHHVRRPFAIDDRFAVLIIATLCHYGETTIAPTQDELLVQHHTRSIYKRHTTERIKFIHEGYYV